MRITKDLIYLVNNTDTVPMKWEDILMAEIHPIGPLSKITNSVGVTAKETVTARKPMINALEKHMKKLFKYEERRGITYMLRSERIDWAETLKTCWREILLEGPNPDQQRPIKISMDPQESGQQHLIVCVPPYVLIQLAEEAVEEGRLDRKLTPGFFLRGKEYEFDDIMIISCTSINATVYFNDGKMFDVDNKNGSILADRLRMHTNEFVFAGIEQGTTASFYVNRDYMDLKGTEAHAINWSGNLLYMLTVDNHNGKQVCVPQVRLNDSDMQRLKQRLTGKTPYLPDEVSSYALPYLDCDGMPITTTEVVWLRNGNTNRAMTYGIAAFAAASVGNCEAIENIMIPETSICWEKSAETPRGICVGAYNNEFGMLLYPQTESCFTDDIDYMRGDIYARTYFRSADTDEFHDVLMSAERYQETAKAYPEGCSLDKGYIWSSVGKIPLSDIIMYSMKSPENPVKKESQFWVSDREQRRFELSMRMSIIRMPGDIHPCMISFAKVLSRLENLPGRKFVSLIVYFCNGQMDHPMELDAAEIDLEGTRTNTAWIPERSLGGLSDCPLHTLCIKKIGPTPLYIDHIGLKVVENALRG